jgi:hypothetical protein
MSIEVKIFVALAPLFLIAMVIALTQGNWLSVAVLAILEVVIFVVYRVERRNRSASGKTVA